MTTQTNIEKPEGLKVDPTKLVKRLKSISDIRQFKGVFEVFAKPGKSPFRVKLGTEMKTANASETAVQVIGEYHFIARNALAEGVVEDSAEDVPFAEIRATFMVHYSLDVGEVPTEDELKVFAASNGAFNLHPYWREYIRDCLGRAGLPVYQLPLLNPQRMMQQNENRQAPVSGRDET